MKGVEFTFVPHVRDLMNVPDFILHPLFYFDENGIMLLNSEDVGVNSSSTMIHSIVSPSFNSANAYVCDFVKPLTNFVYFVLICLFVCFFFFC